ncbi:MAG TPA: hypothetical protein VMF69_14810 [Gemmataceae bacterium]|nr:hypothetical protein [Gemmataceae bacterium]
MPALMLAAIYAIPIVMALRPVDDFDIWWHLSAGKWVCAHRAVPVTDPLSRWGADKPWIAYSWLFEVLVYRLYEAFGLAGIVAYRVAMSLAVVAALHRLVRRREPRFLVATFLTALAALALVPLLTERPWLFTILFSTLTLDVVLDLRDGRGGPGIWLLPLVYALWANLHIQFIYGLFLLGLACLPFPGWRCGLTKRWTLAGLCLLATLANPYHVRLCGLIVELATQAGPLGYITEMHALAFRQALDWMVLLLGAAAVFVLGRRRRLSSFEVLLLASTGFFAFRSQRDLWFLVLAAVAILCVSETDIPRSPVDRRGWAAAAVLLAGLIGLLCWQRDLSEENLRRKVADVFPVEVAAVLAERGYPGPLFNDYDWGGFLAWTLPHLPVVLDGRANLHGDERILRLRNTWAAGPGWRDDPDLESAGVVLANASSPLSCVLVLDERFQLVHEDPLARVFVRKRPGSQPSHLPIRGQDACPGSSVR